MRDGYPAWKAPCEFGKDTNEMSMKVLLTILFCFSASALFLRTPNLYGDNLQDKGVRAKAGAYYFDGWTGQTRHLTERLETEFFDREPVWGWRDDSLDVMEQQIDYAADNALAFFAFDWYYPEGENKETPLNTGLELYLQSNNRDRLEFCLLVANHGGFRIGPGDWEIVCDKWIALFKQPTHLMVNGKPLIIFFSPWELKKAFGGTAEGVKQAFEAFRQKAAANGLKGVAIAACCTPGPENNWSDLDDLAASGYDIFTGYNYHGYINKGGVKIQAFANMIEGHEDIWNRFAVKTSVPYIPVVTTGWDKRPWEAADLAPEKQSPYYPDRTHLQVADFVERAIRWMDQHPERTTEERLVLLYAWNENGEGGYLTPTKSQGDIYLRAIGDVLVK